jgi:hypothetical protein
VSETRATVREVLDVVVAAGRHLEWPRPDPARALELVAPYAECEEFADARPDQAGGLRCVVCAVVGDCYRSLGDAEVAAGWYIRARDHARAGGCAPFFAPLFAQMVLDHRMVAHYGAALECLRANRAAWRAQPLLTRLYWEVVSFWWLRPYQWRARLREARVLRELEALVGDGGGSA